MMQTLQEFGANTRMNSILYKESEHSHKYDLNRNTPKKKICIIPSDSSTSWAFFQAGPVLVLPALAVVFSSCFTSGVAAANAWVALMPVKRRVKKLVLLTAVMVFWILERVDYVGLYSHCTSYEKLNI